MLRCEVCQGVKWPIEKLKLEDLQLTSKECCDCGRSEGGPCFIKCWLGTAAFRRGSAGLGRGNTTSRPVVEAVCKVGERRVLRTGLSRSCWKGLGICSKVHPTFCSSRLGWRWRGGGERASRWLDLLPDINLQSTVFRVIVPSRPPTSFPTSIDHCPTFLNKCFPPKNASRSSSYRQSP